MRILLETERLRLRRFTESDADPLFRLDNDPEVMRYINGGTAVSREIIQNEILPGFCRYDPRLPWSGIWAAEEKASGEFLGWFSFRLADEIRREVTLGYRLKRAAWGQGYATEGAAALIRLGFTVWGVQRVTAATYEENLASRHVMEKAGMRFVRRFRLSSADILSADTFHAESAEVWDGDDVEYALEKGEWGTVFDH